MIFLSVQSWCFFLLQGLPSNLQGRAVQGVDVDSLLCYTTAVSPQVSYGKDICFEHKNSGLFLHQFALDETEEYMNHFHDTPRYEWLWLG